MRAQLREERTLWPVLMVFVLSVLVTLLFWILLPARFQVNEGSDYPNYYEPVARSILTGNGFTFPNGMPAIERPPGFPILLAGIFGLSDLLSIPENLVLSVFLVLCMALASVFVFAIARSVWGSLPALVASFIWMIYPLALWLTKQPNSELPFLVFLFGGFYLFWRALLRRNFSWFIYLVCGFMLGIATLIRPIAIGLGLVLGVVLWVAGNEATVRSRVFLMAVLLFGNAIVILPWGSWTYFKTGRATLLGTNGVTALRAGLTFAVNSEGFRHGMKIPPDVATLMLDIETRTAQLQSVRDVVSIAAGELQARPLVMIKLFAIKVMRSWYGTDSLRFEGLIALTHMAYLSLLFWGTGTAWKQGKAPKQLAISTWLILVYFWGMTALTYPLARYMVPAIGLSIVTVGALFQPYGRLSVGPLER